MTGWLEFAPLAIVVSLMVLVAPVLRRDALWARWLIIIFLIVLVARYLPWRINVTVLPADLATFQG